MPEELQKHQNSSLSLSKKGQREVTSFTGNGLLYDYVAGVLDAERVKAVEAYIATSKEAQLDLQRIRNGLSYADQLKAVTVSRALHAKLNTPSSYLSVLFQKARFDKWPVGLKWGLEALVVVFVIVTVLSLAPWEKVLKLRLSGTNEVVLTELDKIPAIEESSDIVPTTADVPEFVDEGLKPKDSIPPQKSAAKTAATSPSPKPVAASETAAKTAATAPAAVVGGGAVATTAAKPEVPEASKASAGFLYRGQLAVTNLEAVGPKIVEKITEMGGRKAGEVELGWQKNPDSAYFHFTIPEAKYEDLKEFLSGYGEPRLNRETHPRVMPDGIVRLIITVDEAAK